MKNIVICFLFCFLFGCSFFKEKSARAKSWFTENGRIKVVATTSMCADLIRAVGKERVDVWSLIAPGHDPHSYELVKGDSDFLERADLIVFSGLGLEHSASMQKIVREEKTLVLGDHLLKVAADKLLVDEGGQMDPHVWMDVQLWSELLDPITECLSRMDHNSAALFAERAREHKKQLLQLDQECRNLLMSIPDNKRYLVTAHDAFQYFTRAYLGDAWEGRLAATEGLAPHGQVSLEDLRGVSAFIESHNIHCIFPESYLGRAFLQKVMGGLSIEAHVCERGLCADTMLEEADFDYIQSMRHNARVIYEELHDKN